MVVKYFCVKAGDQSFFSILIHLNTYSNVQLKRVGGEGEFSPVFTVATGEIRGIRFPKREMHFAPGKMSENK